MKQLKTIQAILIIQIIFASALFAGSVGGTIYIDNPDGINKVSAGVEVQAIHFNTATIAKTNDDGDYIFENLAEGTYEIRVILEHYVHDYIVVDIPDGEQKISLDIHLFKEGNVSENSVAGTITDSETGSPIALAHVSLVPNGTLPFLLEAYSDEFGNYKFIDVPNGTYKVLADNFGYKKYEHPDKIEINDTTKTVNLDFSMTKLVPNASLSGIITNQKTGDAIKGAIVTLSYIYANDPSGGALYYETKTDEHGKYEFKELYSETYWFSCSAEDYDEFYQDVKIEGTTNLNFALTPRITGTISGNVFFDENNNKVKNAWIEFIPVSQENNGYWEFTSTDESGNYTAKVPIGSYYVACSYNSDTPESYYYFREFYDDAQSITDAKIINVTENEVIDNINFGIASPKEIKITVSGKVTDDNGNPLSEAMVYLHADEIFYFAKDSLQSQMLAPSALTDIEGNFKISLTRTILSSLEFKLSADKEGFITKFYSDKPDWNSADAFKVQSDTNITNINFSLAPYPTTENKISGTVSSPNGSPLANVFVYGQAINSVGIEQPSVSDLPWAITDADGNYSLENLKNEKYIIIFFGDNYIPEFYNNVYTWEEATPVLANGNISGIDATLDNYVVVLSDSLGNLSSKNISGNITDDNGNLLSGVYVTLQDENGKAVGSARSGNNGSYSIASNAEFSKITASKLGYTSYTTEVGKNSAVHNFTLNKTLVGIENKKNVNVPGKFSLDQNYPNPFNPTTQISFSLPTAQNVKLSIFNIIGEKVATLINKKMSAGYHKYEFNASKLNSGLYLYKLSAGSFVEVKKMMLIK